MRGTGHEDQTDLSTGYIVRRMPRLPRQRIPYLLFNLGYRKFGKAAAWLVTGLGLMEAYGALARRLSYGI